MRRIGGPAQHQFGSESAVCPVSQESQRSPGVHKAISCKLGKGKDCPSLLCAAAASHGALGAFLGKAEHRKHQTMGECAQEGTGSERSESQNHRITELSRLEKT